MSTMKALGTILSAAALTACSPASGSPGTDEETTAPTVTQDAPETGTVTVGPTEEPADEQVEQTGPGTGDGESEAMDALFTLRVVAHDIAPYDRDDFGGRWVDFDGTGCTTRQDVLRRDATEWVGQPGSCQPEQLVIQDRYSRSAFVALNPADVEIDHVVSIHDAWLTGAQDWDTHSRVAFYQDKLNLVATAGPVNGAKSNLNAAQWMPPAEGAWCDYAARTVAVKTKWDLGVTDAEQMALATMLSACPGKKLPTGDEPTPVFDATPYLTGGYEDVPVNPAPAAQTGTDGSTDLAGEVWYENCDAVRAAGAAPVHRGEPGYRPGLDRDGDGVGCQ